MGSGVVGPAFGRRTGCLGMALKTVMVFGLFDLLTYYTQVECLRLWQSKKTDYWFSFNGLRIPAVPPRGRLEPEWDAGMPHFALRVRRIAPDWRSGASPSGRAARGVGAAAPRP